MCTSPKPIIGPELGEILLVMIGSHANLGPANAISFTRIVCAESRRGTFSQMRIKNQKYVLYNRSTPAWEVYK
jgi:hypothetical protein